MFKDHLIFCARARAGIYASSPADHYTVSFAFFSALLHWVLLLRARRVERFKLRREGAVVPVFHVSFLMEGIFVSVVNITLLYMLINRAPV